MKNSLSVLVMMRGAKSVMVGGDEDCGAGVGGKGGGPLYMTGGLKGGSSVMKWRRSSSFLQGKGPTHHLVPIELANESR